MLSSFRFFGFWGLCSLFLITCFCVDFSCFSIVVAFFLDFLWLDSLAYTAWYLHHFGNTECHAILIAGVCSTLEAHVWKYLKIPNLVIIRRIWETLNANAAPAAGVESYVYSRSCAVDSTSTNKAGGGPPSKENTVPLVLSHLMMFLLMQTEQAKKRKGKQKPRKASRSNENQWKASRDNDKTIENNQKASNNKREQWRASKRHQKASKNNQRTRKHHQKQAKARESHGKAINKWKQKGKCIKNKQQQRLWKASESGGKTIKKQGKTMEKQA